MEHSLQRFLEAKRSVDDRAHNHQVWESLKTALIGVGGLQPLEVLEINGGVGGMFHRILADGVLSRAAYTLIDPEPDNIAHALAHLPEQLEGLGQETAGRPGGLFVFSPVVAVDAVLEAVDLEVFIEREAGNRQWDLIIVNTAFDLIHTDFALAELCSLAYPGALIYFATNPEGWMAFEPQLDPLVDDFISTCYYQRAQNNWMGRGLFKKLDDAGLSLLDVGGMDWIVFPKRGEYPSDEGYFLHYMLDKVGKDLLGCSELDQSRLAAWLAARHAQVERGELVFVSHQLDFLAQVAS